jgi:hypothetical protein
MRRSRLGWRGWMRRCRRAHSRRFRGRLAGFLLGKRFLLGLGFSVSDTVQVLSDLLRNVFGDRARVRLLFGDAIPGQEVNDRFCLDL